MKTAPHYASFDAAWQPAQLSRGVLRHRRRRRTGHDAVPRRGRSPGRSRAPHAGFRLWTDGAPSVCFCADGPGDPRGGLPAAQSESTSARGSMDDRAHTTGRRLPNTRCRWKPASYPSPLETATREQLTRGRVTAYLRADARRAAPLAGAESSAKYPLVLCCFCPTRSLTISVNGGVVRAISHRWSRQGAGWC